MSRQLTIGAQVIDDDSLCFVIAEIGHNHGGDLDTAKKMFKTAAECGVAAVKLQKRDNRSLFTRALYESSYNSENAFGPTYGAHREALELNREQYLELKHYAEELGLVMFATAFDFKSVDFLAELDLPAFKVASGDLLNTPLLKYMAQVGKPMVMSTGGGTLDDVRRAVDAIVPINPRLCLLQCTASYPAEAEVMNLKVITTFREAFPELVIGLSDHQNGIALAPVAYLLGARVIEKHFTLNRAMRGTDHVFSLEPAGLRKLVRDLERTRSALGDGVKRRLECEEKPLFKMGKKLVAARDLPAGHLLTVADVAIKSPNDGLPPYELDRVLGQVLTRPLAEDDNIAWDCLRQA